MSEPSRLLSDPNATPFERDLLESWSVEQPSDAARTRAIALAGGAVASAATAAAAGSLAPKAAAAGSAAVLKWTLLGVALVASGAATVAAVIRSPRPATAPSATSTTTTTTAVTATAASVPTATATATPDEPPTISPGDLPTAASALAPIASGATPAHARPSAAAAPPHESSLAEEIALFDRARAALAGGDANRSLALLDDYDSRFRAGALAQETEVLRVQALVRKGDRATANRVGERFLAAHPTSPHAARVRAILDASSP